MFTDSHAHLTCSACLPQADLLVTTAVAAGVTTIVNICTDAASLTAGLALAERHPGIVYNAGSTTPHDVEKEGESAFDIFAVQAKKGSLVAVGETGLDYYYEHSPRSLQQHYLRRYLQLAKECDLPLIFHCREAFEDLFRIVDEEGGCRAVLHCFTGTAAEAEAVIARDWYLSLSGIITYKKSTELREAIKNVPLDRLLIETDTPYLAPQSHRGQANTPAYLVETAQYVAQLRCIPLEQLAVITSENTRQLLRIS
jgi:TatD DNase family protein